MDGIVKGQQVKEPLALAAKALRQRQTPAELHLWRLLRGNRLNDHHFRRQQVIGPYIVDFLYTASRLIVEVDGPIHKEQAEYDRERDAYLAAHGLQVLRFTNDTVVGSTEHVLAEIRRALSSQLTPSPSQGGGSPPRRAAGRG